MSEMEKAEKRLSRGEIVLMAIVTPLIFCVTFGASYFLILFILGYSGPQVWFYSPIGVFVILVFGVVWVLIIRLLFKTYKKTKFLRCVRTDLNRAIMEILF